MAKPALTETGERIYNQLAPTFFREDERYGWAGALFVSAYAAMLDPAAQIVQANGTVPGYAILFDPVNCPAAWLPWLGQFVGIPPEVGLAMVKTGQTATLRLWIKSPIGYTRGKAAAMILAARTTLFTSMNLIMDPSFEYDAPAVWSEADGNAHGWGWAGLAGAIHAISSAGEWSAVGSKALSITTPSDTGFRDFFPHSVLTVGCSVAAGGSYTWRCVVNVLSLPAKGFLRLTLNWNEGPLTEEGPFISAFNSASITSLGVHVIEMTGTAPAKATKAIPIVSIENGSTAGVMQFYADAFYFGPAISGGTYFDGDSPGAQWTGTPGNSVSYLLSSLNPAGRVSLYTSYGGEAFAIKAVTNASETPNPTATREAIESMMAAWNVLKYEAITSGTYATLEASHAKYSEVEAAHGTYEDLELHPEK